MPEPNTYPADILRAVNNPDGVIAPFLQHRLTPPSTGAPDGNDLLPQRGAQRGMTAVIY